MRAGSAAKRASHRRTLLGGRVGLPAHHDDVTEHPAPPYQPIPAYGAAVDGDRGPGDVPRRVGAQERGDLAEVVGIADHPGGDAGRGGRLARVQRGDALGGVQSGQQRVDGHAVGRDLARQRLRKPVSPARAVFERMRFGIGWRTAIDVIATTRPHCCSRIAGTAS